MDAQQINSVVDHLAAKLAVPSERIIQAYAIRGGTMFTASAIFFVAALFVVIISLYKMESEVAQIIMTLAMFPIFVSLIALAATLPDFLLWWQSPEAYAIVTIVENLQ